MADINDLVADLRAEQEDLDGVLAGLSPEQWDLDTPAEGWKIRDQIAHLAYFDGAVTQSIVDAPAFLAALEETKKDPDFVNTAAKPLVALPAAELFERWRSGRAAMYDAMLGAEPGLRTPWYGPPMSVPSACTARLMETWSHGQDVVDALGIHRPATERIRHVIHIGHRARPFAYANRGMEVPAEDVKLEIEAPNGETWTFGESDTNVIRGTALDMALLVTQRRHRDDTDLVAEGPLAEEFLDVAQAFAGKPGGGRVAGQFPKNT